MIISDIQYDLQPSTVVAEQCKEYNYNEVVCVPIKIKHVVLPVPIEGQLASVYLFSSIALLKSIVFCTMVRITKARNSP